MFIFAEPIYLLLLALIPGVLFYRRRFHLERAINVSETDSIKQLTPSFFLRVSRFMPIVKYLALILMIVAMARPQWGVKQVNIMTEGINIVLAVDISGSMAALDFKRDGKIVDRLEAVKGVIDDFIMKRQGDRIGMVVFGTDAFTQIPLTRDYNTISWILERLSVGAAGPNTALGDAIGISLKRIEDIKSKSNVIILLTDGQSNSGQIDPLIAAKIAAQKNVKIYTVGVGSRGKAPFLIRDQVLGDRYVYRNVDMDERTLKQISKKTDGLYFSAKNTDGLKRVYETIDALEKTEVEIKTYAEYRELYPWFLFPSLLFLGFWILLSNTRFLKIP